MAQKDKSMEEIICWAEVRLGLGKTAGKLLPEYRTQYKWRREYELHISHYDPVPALFSA